MKRFFLAFAVMLFSLGMFSQTDESNFSGESEIFVIVEQMPEFPGGQQALFRFLCENVKYPLIAQENGIQGRVIVSFVVAEDGSITDVTVERSGGDASLDKEAVRVINCMPKWKPGKQKGKVVRVRYTVPVNFRLDDGNNSIPSGGKFVGGTDVVKTEKNNPLLRLKSKTYELGALRDTAVIRLNYEPSNLTMATHEVATFVKNDTVYKLHTNLKTGNRTDVLMFCGKSVSQAIYDDEENMCMYIVPGETPLTTIVSHYRDEKPTRKYVITDSTLEGKFLDSSKRVVLRYVHYIDGSKEDAFFNAKGQPITPVAPVRKGDEATLQKALASAIMHHEECKLLPIKPYTVELEIDASGYCHSWRFLDAEKQNEKLEGSILFKWQPAMVGECRILGFDTLTVPLYSRQHVFGKGAFSDTIILQDLPQTGDTLYPYSKYGRFLNYSVPFRTAKDSLLAWSASLQYAPSKSYADIAVAERRDDKVVLRWTNANQRLKDEYFRIVGPHEMVKEKDVMFVDADKVRHNYFEGGNFVSSVLLSEDGDTLSMWKDATADSPEKYVCNIDYHVVYTSYVDKDGKEVAQLGYRPSANESQIVRPKLKKAVSIKLPSALKAVKDTVLLDRARRWNLSEFAEVLFLYKDILIDVYAMVDKNGQIIRPQLALKHIKTEMQTASGSPLSSEGVAEAKGKHIRKIMRYIEGELKTKKQDIIPGTVDGEPVLLPYLFTVTAK